jgi:hypothetical protein
MNLSEHAQEKFAGTNGRTRRPLRRRLRSDPPPAAEGNR